MKSCKCLIGDGQAETFHIYTPNTVNGLQDVEDGCRWQTRRNFVHHRLQLYLKRHGTKKVQPFLNYLTRVPVAF